MLVFIENTPRAYAWGSRDALPALLGTAPTGEPQAELWLGAHPGDPATMAKGVARESTLIDLIERDPEAYGVDGGQLPFLLKVLAIGAPLSLQVHPDKQQAEAGFDAEDAAGGPRDAPQRNYGDRSHKPELLVALGEVTALSGFRPLGAARDDLETLAEAAGPGAGGAALREAAERCLTDDPENQEAQEAQDRDAELRAGFMRWALSGAPEVVAAVQEIGRLVQSNTPDLTEQLGSDRLTGLRQLAAAYPDDPGVLISLLLHLVRLLPGEALFLGARQLHAYLSGIAVEVMAASDNVLRAGLTPKHVDAAEVLRVISTDELADPRFRPRLVQRGLVAYEPEVPDFRLLRARLCEPGEGQDLPFGEDPGDRAQLVRIETPYPLVLIVTAGRVRVERAGAEYGEVAGVGRGQSLYVSAGAPVELSGVGEVFVATVGSSWG